MCMEALLVYEHKADMLLSVKDCRYAFRSKCGQFLTLRVERKLFTILHFGGAWPLIFKPRMSENVPKQSEKVIIPEYMRSLFEKPWLSDFFPEHVQSNNLKIKWL